MQLLRQFVILTLPTVLMMVLTTCSTVVRLLVLPKVLLLMKLMIPNAKWMLRGGGWLHVDAS